MIILNTLHFNKNDFKNASKDEMIVQILKRCKISILDGEDDQVPKPKPPQPLPKDKNETVNEMSFFYFKNSNSK